MSKTAGKIIGGFLAGAGIITYLLHTEAGRKIKGELEAGSKDVIDQAEGKIAEAREQAVSFADQVMNYVVDNRQALMDTAGSIINTFLKKR